MARRTRFFGQALLLFCLLGIPASHRAEALSAFPHASAAQSVPEFDIRSVDQVGGGISAAVVQGGLAYLGVGPRLQIVDVGTNPAVPVELGGVTVWKFAPKSIAVAGGHTFVINRDGLRIFDTTDPARIRHVGQIAIPESNRIAVAGSYVYVTVSHLYDYADPSLRIEPPDGVYHVTVLHVIDISRPEEPIEVAVSDPMFGEANGIAVAEPHVFISASGSGGEPRSRSWGAVTALDVSDPREPRRIASLELTAATRVAANAGLVYVAHWTGLSSLRLSSDQLEVIGSASMPNQLIDLSLDGNRAYATDVLGLLHVIDLADPTSPRSTSSRPVSSGEDGGEPGSAVALDGSVYVVDPGRGLAIIDASDSELREVGLHRVVGHVWFVALAGRFVYAANRADVWVMDASASIMSTYLGHLRFPGGLIRRLAATEHTLFVADGREGLRVIDFRNPASPRQVAALHPEQINDIVLGGHHLFVSAANRLRVLDVSNPSAPREVGSLTSAEWLGGLTFYGERLFASFDQSPTMRVIDVLAPDRPREIGSVETGRLASVAVGGHLYVVSNRVLRVFDITGPGVPRPVTTIGPDEVGVYSGMAVAAGQLVAPAGSEVHVFDIISDPARPRLAAKVPVWAGSSSQGPEASGSRIYSPSQSLGLQILELRRQDHASPGSRLMVDDFEDPDTGWLPVSDMTPSARLGYENGEYRIQTVDPSAGPILLSLPVRYRDTSFTVDAMIGGDIEGRYLELVCRRQVGMFSAYSAVADLSQGSYRLIRRDNAQPTTLRRASGPRAIPPGEPPFRIGLTCAGNRISLTVNRALVATVQDDTYRDGSLAIGAGSFIENPQPVEARFDNLVVERPPG